jgi:methylglutaconyl-CoA hydratase
VTPDLVLLDIDPRGVATATLNRPEVGNAYNQDMLTALIAGLERLAANEAVRCLVIRGAGRHFQAGPTYAGWARSHIIRRPRTTPPRWPRRGQCSC